MNRSLLSVCGILLLSACVQSVGPSTLEPVRPEQAGVDNPFEYYARCGDEWADLFDQWLGTGVSGSESLDELYRFSATDDQSALGSALQAAWSVETDGISDEEQRLRRNFAFFEALAPLLSNGCSAASWMALALEGREDTQWLMEVAGSELDLNPDDPHVAMTIANALIKKQTKSRNTKERGSARSH